MRSPGLACANAVIRQGSTARHGVRLLNRGVGELGVRVGGGADNNIVAAGCSGTSFVRLPDFPAFFLTSGGRSTVLRWRNAHNRMGHLNMPQNPMFVFTLPLHC